MKKKKYIIILKKISFASAIFLRTKIPKNRPSQTFFDKNPRENEILT